MKKSNPVTNNNSHLSSDELLRYYRHLLSGKELNQIESHLKECELCTDALKGISEMRNAMNIYNITHELKNRMNKRIRSRRKIFTGMDLLSIVLILFILGILLIVTYYFFYIS